MRNLPYLKVSGTFSWYTRVPACPARAYATVLADCRLEYHAGGPQAVNSGRRPLSWAFWDRSAGTPVGPFVIAFTGHGDTACTGRRPLGHTLLLAQSEKSQGFGARSPRATEVRENRMSHIRAVCGAHPTATAVAPPRAALSSGTPALVPSAFPAFPLRVFASLRETGRSFVRRSERGRARGPTPTGTTEPAGPILR
jgi:hypothetical protein